MLLDSRQGNGTLFADLSPPIRGAFYSEGMSNSIPRVVVSSPDLVEIWGKMDYKELFDDGNFRDLRKAVDAIQDGEAEAPEAREFRWTQSDSDRYWGGSFVRHETEKNAVILKKPETGKNFSIAVDRLAPGARNYIGLMSEIHASRAEEAHREAALSAIQTESWESADGKKIEARFVSLVDGKLTIEKGEAGQQFTLPLDRLAAPSQARAKEIAASLVPAE